MATKGLTWASRLIGAHKFVLHILVVADAVRIALYQ